jgi:hypothetical protein
MKKLKLQLQNIDDQIHLLQSKRKVVIGKIQNETCEHRRIKKGGGGSWAEWPDYGCYDVWYECLDCGKWWNEKNLYGKYSLREKLEKNIIKDTSS